MLASGCIIKDKPEEATYVVEVRTALALGPVLLAGIKDMFVRSGLDGWSEAFAAFESQCAAFAAFVERELLPRATAEAVHRDYFVLA